jgi:hypothetical protein
MIEFDDESEFVNKQIFSSEIPDISLITYEKLHPNHLKSELVVLSIFLSIVGIIGFVIAFAINIPINFIFIGLAVFLLFAASLVVIMIKSHHQKGYAIRDKDVLYKEGLFFKSETIIPFNRVQHVEVNQGAVDRMFTLAELGIFTAGGSASDLKIPGLTPPQAHKIKDFLIRKTGHDEEE